MEMESVIRGDIFSGKSCSIWSSVCGVQMRSLRHGYTAEPALGHRHTYSFPLLGAAQLALSDGTLALLPTSWTSLGKLHNVARPQLLCNRRESSYPLQEIVKSQ